MALVQSIQTDFGVEASYWHILSLQVNRVQQAVQVTMAGYIDARTRAAGHRPIAVMTLSLDRADFPGSVDGVRYDAVYDWLKQPVADSETTPFAGSADA